MTDYLHSPEVSDTGFSCQSCGMALPDDLAVLGVQLVELGGTATHWIPEYAHDSRTISCDKRKEGKGLIVCPECNKDGCENCGGHGTLSADGTLLEVGEAEIAGVKKPAQPLTDFEKDVRRGSFNNFRMMREATRSTDDT